MKGASTFHEGLDIAAPEGSPVRALADGVVTWAGPSGSYGNRVTIDHGDGWQTTYAHQRSVDVEVGQRVAGGQQIGAVGSTGRSTGPHLHLEVVRNGEHIDPEAVLVPPGQLDRVKSADFP